MHITKVICGIFIVLFSLLNGVFALQGHEQHTHISDNSPLPQLDKEFLIVVHIVRNEEGEPGIQPGDISNNISPLNSAFAPIGVSFNICEFRYIDNFRYNDIIDERRDEMMAKYHVENRINLFMISEFDPDGNKCGDADLNGVTYKKHIGIVIKKGDCHNPTVFIHEMGHFFGLPHTFDTENGLELADGSNCETAGDGVCDTPADPYVDGNDESAYVNANCEFISNQKDSNGDFYDPDVSNIMSYYSKCRCSGFTDGQYRKMAENYQSNPFLW